MKLIYTFCFFFFVGVADAAESKCTCKCVVKDSEGHLSTVEGSGKNREKAGDDLKKNLAKSKCELSPTCTGACSLDILN